MCKDASSSSLRTDNPGTCTWVAINRRVPRRMSTIDPLNPPDDESQDVGLHSYFSETASMTPQRPDGLNRLKVTSSLENCAKCRTMEKYRSAHRLRRHLGDRHFRPIDKDRPTFEQDSFAWMTNSERWLKEQSLHHLELLAFVAEFAAKKLHARCLHIKLGVTNNMLERDRRFLLRVSIYDAFVHIVAFIDSVEAGAWTLTKGMDEAQTDNLPSVRKLKILGSAIEVVRRSSTKAFQFLDMARNDLYKMAWRSSPLSTMEKSLTFGSNYVLLSMISILATRPITIHGGTRPERLHVVDLYQKAHHVLVSLDGG